MLYHTQIGDRRISVAGRVNGDSIEVAVAKCHINDNFTKKMGRLIAEGRLRKNKVMDSITIEEGASVRKTFIEMAPILAQRSIERKYCPKSNSYKN